MGTVSRMPAPGLTTVAELVRRFPAPNGAAHATGLSYAGLVGAPAVQAPRPYGLRFIALSGTPARGAPV